MNIPIYILFLSLIFSNNVELPIGLTEFEKENIDLIYTMGRDTDPPQGPVRNIAEFERMSGVLIRYPFGISTSIIREMAEDIIVYCLVSNNSQNSAYNSMNNAGVNMDNVEFILGSTDSYWTRDYGPWWVVDGNRDVSIVDFTYNRPRPNDNQAPAKVSNYLDVPYFATDIITAGGNYMTDGLGIAASSDLIYEENSMSNSQIHQDMLDYYGIHTYHAIPDPNNTYIDHIDCWGKFLSPQKILLREVPTSHAQYDEIEEVVDYFENVPNGYGEPWEIYRVYTPNNQPYTNSIILNNKVLVPTMNSSWDDEALESYQEAMPGYEILGFTGSWESTDALHCRTKGIPDLEMLQIFHNPIDNQIEPQNFYSVEVIIDDLSEAGLIDDELKVVWWTDEMDEVEEILLNVCEQDIPDCYNANIPSLLSDSEIKYFIQAIDLTGRFETLPMAGYFSFNAIGGTPAQDGDINIDGIINVLDIVVAVNHVLEIDPITGYELDLADMNDDGVVNILDIISIVNIIIG